jgi:MFS family permease
MLREAEEEQKLPVSRHQLDCSQGHDVAQGVPPSPACTSAASESPCQREVSGPAEIWLCLRQPEVQRQVVQCCVLYAVCLAFGLGLIEPESLKSQFKDSVWLKTFESGAVKSLPLLVSAVGSFLVSLPTLTAVRVYLVLGVGCAGAAVVFLLNTMSSSPWAYICYKIAVGVLGALIPSIVGPYVNAVAPGTMRSFMLGMISNFVYIGIILAFFLNAASPGSPLVHLAVCTVLMAIPAILSASRFLPPYLSSSEAKSEAKPRSIARVLAELGKKSIWFWVFCSNVFFFRFLNQFSGVTFSLLELGAILEDCVGNYPAVISLAIGALHTVGFAVQMTSNAYISRIGKTRALMLSLGVSTVGQFISFFSPVLPLRGAAMFLGQFLLIVGLNLGLSFVPIMLPYDYFPTPEEKAKVAGIAGTFDGLMNWLSVLVGSGYQEYANRNSMSSAGVFGIFGSILLVGTVATVLFYSDKSGLRLDSQGNSTVGPGNNTFFMKLVEKCRSPQRASAGASIPC